jgi:hypothetical protein
MYALLKAVCRVVCAARRTHRYVNDPRGARFCLTCADGYTERPQP